MRAFPLLFALTCLVGISVAQAQTQTPRAPDTTEPLTEKDGLKISISADDVGEGTKRYIGLRQNDPHINVVLQNTSTKSLNIFQEGTPWGYGNVTLKITKIDGEVLLKPLIISKKQANWFATSRSSQVIEAGGVLVREVRLQIPAQILNPDALLTDEDLTPRSFYYSQFPVPKKDEARQITMSAVFANSTSPDDKEQKVWTGEVTSPQRDYLIRWLDEP